MAPESKCVSLDTAKRLKDNGFPQETERWWNNSVYVQETGQFKFQITAFPIGKATVNDKDFILTRIAAPDAQEIGELLPVFVTFEEDTYFFEQSCTRFNQWYVRYCSLSRKRLGKDYFEGTDKRTEAEARAACWLYLKENKLI